MKTKFTAIILCIIFSVLMLAPCMAADGADVNVLLDGHELNFDVPPVIMAGRTMVPMRAVFEALGYKVKWDGEKRSINAKKDGKEINMYIDFYTMWVDGTAVNTDVAPCIVNDRTLVPLRAVSEMSGCAVDWNESTRTVFIDTTRAPSISPAPVQGTAEATPAPTPKDIELDVNELTINEGKAYEFHPSVKAYLADKKIVWESSDWTVCSITSSGKLGAEKDGTCTITARIGEHYDTCDVTVKNVPENPDIEIMGYDTTKLFTENREYILITIRNYGQYPVELEGTATYSYLDGAEGITGFLADKQYDIYTMPLKADKTVIEPKTYETITFKRDGAPKVGAKTKKEDFRECMTFKFNYDGKAHTATKYKKTNEKDKNGKELESFTVK